MTEQKAMLEALAALDATRARVHVLERDQPDGWKHQYLAARREVPTQLARVNQVANEWLEAEGDTPDGRRLRELLGKMRSLLAEHQSRWPVVTISIEDKGYRTSMGKLDAVLLEMTDFVRSRMA